MLAPELELSPLLVFPPSVSRRWTFPPRTRRIVSCVSQSNFLTVFAGWPDASLLMFGFLLTPLLAFQAPILLTFSPPLLA